MLTLALGIGANTAVFSALYGIVLAPLPYTQAESLVAVALFNRNLKYATQLSYPDFLDWQRGNRSFEGIAAFAQQSFDITGPGQPEHVNGKQISSRFFDTLGIRPALGRDFTPQDDLWGAAPAVIITHRLWVERFAENPAALGARLNLFGTPFTVIGVLPRGFQFGNQEADVFTTIGRRDPLLNNDRSVHNVLCIARLRTGIGIAQARADMDTLQEGIDRLNPATERGQGIYIVPLKQLFVGDVSGTLLLLFGAVGLVLLIACANVANLLLARSVARCREFSIRIALGASRARIVRQLITESLILSVAGGLLGLAFAAWGSSSILAAAPGKLPRADNVGMNAWVLLFALTVSAAVAILFGLMPALRTSRVDVQTGLKEGVRSSTGPHRRTQGLLVSGEIALALVLLAGSALLLRTLHNLLSADPGFDAQHVFSFQVGLSSSVNTASKIRSTYRQMVESIREIPGVDAADITALVPLGQGSNEGPFWIGSRQPASMAEIPRAIYYPTGPHYLRTMKIPLLRGRALSSTDSVDSEPVVLIDTLLAERYFSNDDPVGQTLTIPHWGAGPAGARIVGVVGHVHQYGLDGSIGEKPQIYYSLYQLPDAVLPMFQTDVTLTVRMRAGAGLGLPLIRAAIDKTGAGQSIYNIRTMQELVSGSMARQRFPMLLLIAFAILALLLACIGIYGVVSYLVAQRLKEIGIRIAVGAGRRDVVLMIVRQGIRLALAGIAAGSILAVILVSQVRSFSGLLYGVRSVDPTTFVSVAFLLITATLTACHFPARRAARVDPIIALRNE